MTENERSVTMHGNKLALAGEEPTIGEPAPAFTAVGNDLSEVSLSDLGGKVLVISSVPSLDTPVCEIQTKRFNEEAGNLGDNVRVLTISVDLPFAQKRWCGAEGVENLVTLSDHRTTSFGQAWGVLLPGPRLLARAVFIVDAEGKVAYTQIVPEITDEPDYEDVLQALAKVAG